MTALVLLTVAAVMVGAALMGWRDGRNKARRDLAARFELEFIGHAERLMTQGFVAGVEYERTGRLPG